MSGDLKFNYSSARSQKARIGCKLNSKILTGLSALSIILIVAGFLLVSFGYLFGWVLVGVAFVPAMIVEWYNGELKHIKVPSNPQTIDDWLSGEVLGRLSAQPTPQELATIVGGLAGGYFFALRFGLGAKFLQEIASPNPDDLQPVWQAALDLRAKTSSRNISAAILVVALISNHPKYETLLSHLQLGLDDLIGGIRWYDGIRSLVERDRQPYRTGGVARDWSFGWTPLLDRFSQNISKQIDGSNRSLIELTTHGEALDQLINIFSKNGRQNVALVGPLGVGKTELVDAFAARLVDASSAVSSNLKFRQVLTLDAASLIAAAPDRGGLENLLPQILNEAYTAKNIILCLDNAQLFFEDGVGSVDISNVLLPVLKAGALRMILTMDEQHYLKISKQNPEIASAINRITVAPTDRGETLAVMQNHTLVLEYQSKVRFMYQALMEAYRYGDRYMYDLAMPGKALKVLELAANYAEDGLVTVSSVHQAVEKTMDVKVGAVDSDDERDKLLNLESLIHQRMINQTRAVQVVSDAIRRARAGVRNQDRPIGTFLFLGPTGVGKTELAKSLAAVYFGGEERLIRLDMNEYVSSDDVKRLIADGGDNPNSLTAQVMKQPFSVVLLDEIEKAHPDVLSTLLQMLDEGILRDERNREVNFRDAIIIATSNAGADRIREYIARGYDISQFENQFVDELISSHQFRPEFLNRFDEIVVFRPLKKAELLQVVDLILAGINKTLAAQKINVKVTDDAKNYLVDAGYDPRLGARPMRRVVQRAVENTVAKMMLSGDVEPGSAIELNLDQIKQLIETKKNAQQIVDDNKI